MVPSTHAGNGRCVGSCKLGVSVDEGVQIPGCIVLWPDISPGSTGIPTALHGAESIAPLKYRKALAVSVFHLALDHVLIRVRIIPMLVELEEDPNFPADSDWLGECYDRDFVAPSQGEDRIHALGVVIRPRAADAPFWSGDVHSRERRCSQAPEPIPLRRPRAVHTLPQRPPGPRGAVHAGRFPTIWPLGASCIA